MLRTLFLLTGLCVPTLQADLVVETRPATPAAKFVPLPPTVGNEAIRCEPAAGCRPTSEKAKQPIVR